jgi:hypothetical protein
MVKTFLVFSKEKFRRYILPAFLFLGIAFLVILFYIFTTDVIKTLHNPFDVSYERLTTCQSDSDCMVVDFSDCCFGKTAINKKHLKQYNRTPEWQKTGEDCRFANCPWTKLNDQPECALLENGDKRCVLSREPKEGYYLRNCLDKYAFIQNEECGDNCSSDKMYVFYVGGGGRYEEIMQDTSFLAGRYEEVLPTDIKKQVLAVYEIINCENCQEFFSIRESTALSQVGLNSFCDFIYKQNLMCDDCIKVREIEKQSEE